jgi:hypothetical protein
MTRIRSLRSLNGTKENGACLFTSAQAEASLNATFFRRLSGEKSCSDPQSGKNHCSIGNIGLFFGLTVAKFSEIQARELGVADYWYPMDASTRGLGLFVTGEAATVHQVFTGSVAGD